MQSDSSESEGYNELEDAVECDPFSLEAHLELIETYRSHGELDKLTSARHRAATFVPLPERVWLSWIEDIQKFVENEEETTCVEKLYQRAVKSLCGSSFELYNDFIDFKAKNSPLNEVKSLYDEALLYLGFHPVHGPKLFEKYRQFELSAEDPDRTANAMRLFLRQCDVPHPQLDAVLEELQKHSVSEDIVQDAKDRIEKSKLEWEKIAPLEEKIQSGGIASLEASKDLVHLARQSGNLLRVESCLLRAAFLGPGESQRWIDFGRFLHERIMPSKACAALNRGVMEAPSQELWEEYLLFMELNDKPFEEVRKAAEIAHAQGYKVLLFVADVARRKELEKEMREAFERALEEAKDETDRVEVLFHWMHVESYTTEDVAKINSVGEELLKLRSDVETWRMFLSSLRHVCLEAESQEVLRAAYQRGCKCFPQLQVDFLHYERQVGTIKTYIAARHEAVSSPSVASQHPATPARASIGPCLGSSSAEKDDDEPLDKRKDSEEVGDLDLARLIAAAPNATYKEAQDGRAKTRAEEMSPAKRKREEDGGKKAKKKKDNTEAPAPSPHYLAQTYGSTAGEIDEGEKTVYIGGLDWSVKEVDLEDMLNTIPEFKAVRVVKDFQGRSKGFAYADFETNKGVQKASKKYNQTELHGCTITVLASKPTKQLFDDKTAFVLNLPEDAHAFFAPLVVVAVRRISGNRAYVDFESTENVIKALEKSGCEVDGKAVQVSRSIPMKDHRWQTARARKDVDLPSRANQEQIMKMKDESQAASQHSRVLFVKNLSFSLTEEQLKAAFEEYGGVTEATVVQNGHGRSRGFGFVEMEDENMALASLALSGRELAGKVITVSRSHRALTKKNRDKPTEESRKGEDGKSRKGKKGKGKGKGKESLPDEETPERRPESDKPRMRLGIGFKPPAKKPRTDIAQEGETAEDAKNPEIEETPKETCKEAPTEEPKGGLSNADFRKFLLG